MRYPNHLPHPTMDDLWYSESCRTSEDHMNKPPKITADLLFRAKSVVFDLDGTLVDSVLDVALAYCQTLQKFGFEPPPESIYLGPPAETVVRMMIGQDADRTLVADIVNEFRRTYDMSDYPETTLYPGAAELLKRLKSKGIRLSLATYKGIVSTRRLLEVKGISALFDEVLSINLNGQRWTKYQMLAYIMEATQTLPTETFFFGDSVGDMEAGKDHGIATVAVLYGYEPGEQLLAAVPNFVCESLMDI